MPYTVHDHVSLILSIIYNPTIQRHLPYAADKVLLNKCRK
jgi:hypothetical protein